MACNLGSSIWTKVQWTTIDISFWAVYLDNGTMQCNAMQRTIPETSFGIVPLDGQRLQLGVEILDYPKLRLYNVNLNVKIMRSKRICLANGQGPNGCC